MIAKVRVIEDSHGTEYTLGARRVRLVRINHPRDPGVYALFTREGGQLFGLTLAEAEGEALAYCYGRSLRDTP